MSNISEHLSKLRIAADILSDSSSAVAFTGAGLSTRSGIPDFRSPGVGLWARIDEAEDGELQAGSIQGFSRDPQAFYNNFGSLVKRIYTAEPNPAHFALAELEAHGYIKALITQNADMLHQRAGSKNVIEVHGSLTTATCITCYKQFPAVQLFKQFFNDGRVPRCKSCGGVMKPNVILTGEQLPAQAILAAMKAVQKCGVLLIAGTSLAGGPATALTERAHDLGAKLLVINHLPTLLDSQAEVVIHADVVDVLPALIDVLLGSQLDNRLISRSS